MESPPSTPFENIALALSGGGFRAAAYGLGTMSYLAQLPWRGKTLLEQVSFISSTSGGSITNAYYTLRLYQGKSASETFAELYKLLEGHTLLDTAVGQIDRPKVWKDYPHKHQNLINAFAVTYDQLLYDRKTLAEFWNPQGEPHVEEICINSTELNNGMSFRFRAGRHLRATDYFGNRYLHFSESAMDKLQSLRIGDVVAASSCFPLGFEPLIFPQDFHTGSDSPEELLKSLEMNHNNPLHLGAIWQKPFGLIDGGVVDNQGMYSFQIEDQSRGRHKARQGHSHSPKEPSNADAKAQVPVESASTPADRSSKQHSTERPFSLLIISDVASYFQSPYRPERSKLGLLGHIPLLIALPALGLAAILPWAALVLFWLQDIHWANHVLLLPGFVLSFLIIGLAVKTLKTMLSPQTGAPVRVLRKHVLKLLRRPLHWWADVLQNRQKSFVMLAQDVFLKQIRRMHLSKAYEDADVKDRLLSNFIYDLCRVQRDRRVKDLEDKDHAWWPKYKQRLTPSALIEVTAEHARNVGTTLWFDPHRSQDLRNVTATGQFTTCYNLIKYINRWEAQHGPLSVEMEALRGKLLEDWGKFQENPHWELRIEN